MKILANDGLDRSGIDALTAKGFEVITARVEQHDLADYINREHIRVLLVRSATQVRRELIDACPSLEIIGRGGVGMDNIDVAYAREKGLHVINTPAASSVSVAELVFAHLFSGARFLQDANRRMPVSGNTAFAALKKQYAAGIELRGKTIGIVGMGRIGQEVARMALGLGMNVMASDPFVTTAIVDVVLFSGQTLPVEVATVPLQEVLRQADFITLHVPAQKNGPLIGEHELRIMKDGVALINCSRGGIIDEPALLHALDNGKVAFAGLDVFVNEPSPATALLNHPRISVTPHTGAATLEAQDRIGLLLAEQIGALLPLEIEG